MALANVFAIPIVVAFAGAVGVALLGVQTAVVLNILEIGAGPPPGASQVSVRDVRLLPHCWDQRKMSQ